jgi:hypothetical protein
VGSGLSVDLAEINADSDWNVLMAVRFECVTMFSDGPGGMDVVSDKVTSGTFGSRLSEEEGKVDPKEKTALVNGSEKTKDRKVGSWV